MKFFYTLLLLSFVHSIFSQASYTSAASGLWSLSSSWTLSSGTDSDGDGIPDADDNVTIAATHTITVAVPVSCLAFTMSNANSTIALGAAMTLNVNGNFNVIRGTFTGTTGTLNLTGSSLTFGNTTGGPTVQPKVTASALTITSQRTTYSSAVTMTKLAAGTTVDSWRGGNTFNGSFTFTNASADPTDPVGDVYFGASTGDPTDVFNGRATFYLTGCARLRIPQRGTATFNGVTSFYAQGSGTNHDRIQPAREVSASVTFNDSLYLFCTSATTDIHIAYDAGTSATFNGPIVASHAGASAAAFFFGQDGTVLFNNHVTFNNVGSGTITVTGGSGNSTLASGKQFFIGSSGFSSGILNIQGFTQLGTTAQTLVLTGTSALRVGAVTGGCIFNGNVNFTAPSLTLDSTVYNGTATFSKTGSAANNCGGNRFNNTFSISNSGTGNIAFSQVAADVFTNTCTVTNTAAGSISMSRTFNTTYPQNIILNSTAAAGAIGFGSANGTSTLNSGVTFGVGGTGFSAGTLTLRLVTAPAAQTLNLGSGATFNAGSSSITGNTFGSTVSFGAGIFSAVSNNITGTTTFTASTSVTATSNTITSQATFTAPTITATTNTITGNTTMTGSTALTATSNTMGAQATLSGGGLVLVSNVITGNATLSKTGSPADDCGNNNFGGTFSLTNTGTGGIRFSQITGADVFANTVTINSNSNGGVTMSRTFNTTYPENIQVSNTGTNGVFFGFNGGASTLNAGKTITTSTFNNGTLEFRKFTQVGNTSQSLNFSGTALVRFGNGNNTSCYFNGDLNVNGAATNSFTADTSFFYRNMTVSAGAVVTFESEYNNTTGTTNFTKTGTTTDDCGKNIFTGTTTILNSGTGALRFGQIIGGDIFQNDLSLTCGGTGGIAMSRTFASTYNGNIANNSYGTGGISFAGNNGASVMAATKSINTGGGGFSSGTLTIDKFTQNGSATNTLAMTGGANLSIGTATKISDFGGDVLITNNSNTTCNSSVFRRNFTMSTNGMQIEACTFNGTSGSTSFTKSQSNSADNNGGNTFNGPFTLTHNGAVRVWMGQTIGADLFVNTVTLNATSSSLIEMARTQSSTFQNNITLNSSSNGGITFGINNGVSTQTANMNISTGTFSNGTIEIRKFTQASGTQTNTFNLPGGTSSTLTIGASATTGCDFGGIMNITSAGLTSMTSSQFRKDFTCTSLGVLMVSNTFNATSGNASITKTGFPADDTNGGNIFNTNCTITNNGSGRLRMSATTGGDTYTGIFTLSNTNSGVVEMARAFATTFSNNIVISNSGSGGITFGAAAGGTSAQAANRSITTGTFTNGPLSIQRFTQAVGTQTNSLILTGSNATIAMGATGAGDDIGGDITMNSDVSINLQASTYQKSVVSTCITYTVQNNTFNNTSGTTTITKTGTSNDDTNGGNIFNGTTSLTINASGGRWRLGSSAADDFNGALTLVQSQASGVLAPSYSNNSTYAGNLTVTTPNTSTTMTFGSAAGGITTFDGANAHSFSITAGSAIPLLTRMVMAKSANDLTLNTRINISSTLTMTQGNINTTQTNILNMNDAATTNIGSAISYINGPMNYDMAISGTTRTLNMPIGKATDWRPVALTVRHSAATSFTYNSEMFNLPANYLFWTLPATVDTVSSMRYWDINRYTTGTTTSVPNTSLSIGAGYPQIQLYFGTNDGVYQGANLTIVKNTSGAPTTWVDIGGSSGIGNNASPVAGNVTSTSSPTVFNSFSRFTLGSKLTGTNPLPVTYANFDVVKQNEQAQITWTTATEENSNYFNVEHSVNGIDFEVIGMQEAAHHSNSFKDYSFIHTNPHKGTNYYRVTEFDYNNATTISAIKSVLFDGAHTIKWYPNPVQSTLFFESDGDATYTVVLYGIQGEQISKQQYNGNAKMDIRSLGVSAGIYLIQIESNGTINHMPLVITE